MQPLPPFHLAFPVDDLDAARTFYRDMLGCTEGRSANGPKSSHGSTIAFRNPTDLFASR